MRFLVTGATGFIGSHVAERIISAGGSVICPVRDVSNLKNLEAAAVEILPWEGLEDFLAKSPPPNYVIHAAAATRSLDGETYRKGNVELTERLLRVFSDDRLNRSLKRFVLVSSQAAAGPAPNPRTLLRESDAPRPISAYGRAKLEAEKIALAFKDAVPVTIIRPSAVFGPRDMDTLGAFKSAKHHIAAFVGARDRWVSLVYVEDLVDAILLAADSPAALGETYFIANPVPMPWRKFALQIAQGVGAWALPTPVPLTLLQLAALISTVMGKLKGRPPLFTLEKAKIARQVAWVCSTEKANRELGWEPATPLQQAIEKTAAWYRAHGYI